MDFKCCISVAFEHAHSQCGSVELHHTGYEILKVFYCYCVIFRSFVVGSDQKHEDIMDSSQEVRMNEVT